MRLAYAVGLCSDSQLLALQDWQEGPFYRPPLHISLNTLLLVTVFNLILRIGFTSTLNQPLHSHEFSPSSYCFPWMRKDEFTFTMREALLSCTRQNRLHRNQSRQSGSEYANTWDCIALAFKGRSTHASGISQFQAAGLNVPPRLRLVTAYDTCCTVERQERSALSIHWRREAHHYHNLSTRIVVVVHDTSRRCSQAERARMQRTGVRTGVIVSNYSCASPMTSDLSFLVYSRTLGISNFCFLSNPRLQSHAREAQVRLLILPSH